MNEKEKERNPNPKREKERERETGISSMIGFDSATSSFLALLINDIEKKEKGKKIKHIFNFAIK